MLPRSRQAGASANTLDRMLKYQRPAGGGLAAVSLATAGAYFVAETTAGHPTPWWPYIPLLGLAALGALAYTFGETRTETDAAETTAPDASPGEDEGDDQQAPNYYVLDPVGAPTAPAESVTRTLGPAVVNRWRHTSDGGKVPSLMRMTHTVMSHPGYGGRQAQDEPPSVKIGMLIACQPIDPSSSGTELRAKFAAFLNSPAVRQLVSALSHVDPSMAWKNMAGHGPRTLEAALAAGADPLEGVPVASALFLPPTAGEELYGRDGRAATLIIYVEPRTADGQVPPASDLATWHERFRLAFGVAAAFADLLANDLGLGAFDDPPAQLGIWLESSPQPLTVMVDTRRLLTLPGSWPSSQYMGWAYATPDGDLAAETARGLLIQLCEYTLHLDDFEDAIAEAVQPTAT